MKAKSNIPEVPEPPKAAPQAEPPEPLYEGLTMVEQLVPFLEISNTYPSHDDCENLNRDAFNRAHSLVELVAWGETAFQDEAGNPTEPILKHAADGITLHLEIMRLAFNTLSAIYPEDFFAHKPR